MEALRDRTVKIDTPYVTGIGTFPPKDEKSQDLSELAGDINCRKIAEPALAVTPVFNSGGETDLTNRGLVEHIAAKSRFPACPQSTSITGPRDDFRREIANHLGQFSVLTAMQASRSVA